MKRYIYFNRLIRSALIILLISASLFSISSLAAQQYPPAFDFEQVLNTYFDDESGLISFQDSKVIFPLGTCLSGQ